jgi:hypothetical protein
MGILSKVAGFFGGGVASTAGAVADVVERFAPGETKKHEMGLEDAKVVEASIQGARAMDLKGHATWFDVLVDGLNRMIRPFAFFSIFGAILGWWELPSPDSIDHRYWVIGMTMITFYFGQRAVMKDLPSALKNIRKALGK